MSRRNNVRGPTSALTEFLRDSGITPTTVAARAATRAQAQDQVQQVAGPSTSPQRSANARRSTRAAGYVSDDLDAEGQADDAMDVDEEEDSEPSSPKKRKLSKAAAAKLKAKQKKKAKKDDEEDEDEEEDAYTALSRSLNASRPPIGNFENCAACKKQFTVTKYTVASSSGDGYLCHQCAKADGIDPFKKPTIRKKRKTPLDKRTITSFEERRFPTLVSLCIQLITEHIDDVEALGDIGALNVEAIARALARSRSLTPQSAHLFYNAANTSLTLFDATNLDSPALETLAYQNANLVSLRLDFCGQLTDESLKVWSTSLPALRRVELLGPFLVRCDGWQDFFKQHPKLEGFLVTQSPRFDLACMKALVKHCSGIKELRLREVGKLNDTFLLEIQKLKRGLWYLDLSEPSESCSEAAALKLISTISKTVTHLSLSNHDLLSDDFLIQGLQKHMKCLESLTLSYLPDLTDAGVADFFANWKDNPPLQSLDLSRNEGLGSAALKAILKHSASSLEHLNINGWKDVSETELKLIGRSKELKKLDVGWCRAVDDSVVKMWLEGETVNDTVKGGCRRLEEVKVWGCNKVTVSCPRRKGVAVLGVESHNTI